jgi:hypothetical protein
LSAGIATPIEDAINLLGSFVEFRAITANVICPGNNSFNPSSLETLLQPGGKMLLTETRLHLSIPALLNADSKEVR